MEAFWLALALIFLAELGDKTQLVALTMACRYNARVVLAGIFVATLVVHVFSVLLGGGVGQLLPQSWVELAAGLAFVGFGLWTLRGDTLGEEEAQRGRGRSAFWVVASTFFLAELGDKTMLGTVALATSQPALPVWLGSTLGMVLSDGLAIAVGRVLGTRLPERAVKLGAAFVFFAFGLWSAVEGARELPAATWLLVAGACLLAGLGSWQALRRAAARRELPPCPAVEQ
ncbi:MAG: TMEM165/GDT1 family protein [Chloroflexi bacterium]|nr:TMEM165/GDT1 family protein [Chloroflexota bacterium]MCL5111129.1 TMEM165/GDT1 family protein [Chloroflexota bacterium]